MLVHGLHTAGVLGACLAFSDHPLAASNFRTLRGINSVNPSKPIAFEALIEVEKIGGTVVIPTLRPEWTFPLDVQRRS